MMALTDADQKALDECMAAVGLLPHELRLGHPGGILGREVARLLEKRKKPRKGPPRRRKVRLAGKPGSEFMIEEGRLEE